jgi:hypothetical protein
MHRAVFAEGLGSVLLAAAVIGSGIMAQQLTSDGAIALLANTLATIAMLAVLIAMLAPISGAHFNPAVSLVSFLRGHISLPVAAMYIAAQLLGCCFGSVLAHAMFELPLIQMATHARAGFGQFLYDTKASSVASARIDRRSLLVHCLDILCESRYHNSPRAVRHILRDSACGCPSVRSGADARSADRARLDSVAFRFRHAWM